MLLDGKTAIIYGGGGSIGGAVARVFAREGAAVHLAGRTLPPLEKVAGQIRAAGGAAETAQVDALDERSVDDHAAAVAAAAGAIDISFNLISHPYLHGTPLTELRAADFEASVLPRVRSTFLTARAAARHMIKQGSGVILAFGGYGTPMANLGGMQVGFGAVESLRQELAVELGPYGIRVITLRTGGVLEALPADFPDDQREALAEHIEGRTMLKRGATLEDVGNAAAFAASDRARAVTAAALNITCGAEWD